MIGSIIIAVAGYAAAIFCAYMVVVDIVTVYLASFKLANRDLTAIQRNKLRREKSDFLWSTVVWLVFS